MTDDRRLELTTDNVLLPSRHRGPARSTRLFDLADDELAPRRDAELDEMPERSAD